MIGKPQWIAKMYPGKTGRDHLGLGSVSSDKILPVLSPGINVLTVHPRYYSFYTFLLDEYWRRDRPRSEKAWEDFYRPRECIFSIGAYLCDRPQHNNVRNIVGGQKTAPLADQQLNVYDSQLDYIDSRLGGYGLYYRSVIAEMGLIYPGGAGFPYPVDVPSKKGKEVAEAFRRAVRDTRYYRDYFDRDSAKVPIAVVREYIRRACLCQLQIPNSSDRALLLDTFLHAPDEKQAAARRATFRLFLDIADQTRGYAIDEHAFRQLLYFRATENGAKYKPRDAVIDVYLRWRMYQAREYYAYALNALWYYLCEWGIQQGGTVRHIPLQNFWNHLNDALKFDKLAKQFGMDKPNLQTSSSFKNLLAWLSRSVGATQADFDAKCKLNSRINEHRLYAAILEDDDPAVMVAGMIAMLGLIYLRFGQPEYRLRQEWEICQMGAGNRLSLDMFIQELRRRFENSTPTIGNVARWIYSEYVILQHQLIANSKLPENTFRFQRDGDRLIFYKLDNRIGFSNSRFEALSTTIHELGLCGDFAQPDHSLTLDGKRLLADGDLS